MKLAKGMELIARDWVVKPKGFRVKFQQMTHGKLVTGYSPSLEENWLDSDVTAWRYAWKLAMVATTDDNRPVEGSLVNITVVDEKDRSVNYYVTGKPQVFNVFCARPF
jgi:hypothetical protein